MLANHDTAMYFYVADKDHLSCVVKILRSRAVHQSLPSSVFSTLRAYSVCLVLVTQDFPQLLLANGTGTCVLVVVAAASLIAELRVNKQIHHSHFCGVSE